MVNEDIVTILNNAVNKGEPLQQAIQILINSGYDSQQVNEASQYVSGGAMQNLQPREDEQLIMAQRKSLLNNNQRIPANQNFQNQQLPNIQPKVSMQQNQQNMGMQNRPYQQNMGNMNPSNYKPNNFQGNMQQNNSQNQKPPQNPDQYYNNQNNSQNIPQRMEMQMPSQEYDPYASQPMPPNQLKQLTQPAQMQNQQIPHQKDLPDIQNKVDKIAQDQKTPQVSIKKKSHKKEIILLIILIFLIGVLGVTIFFRNSILGFLS